MSGMASQITNLTVVYSTVYSGADQRKHQSSASVVFVRGIHRSPVNSPHKGPVTRKMFPFDDVIMKSLSNGQYLRRNFVSTVRLVGKPAVFVLDKNKSAFVNVVHSANGSIGEMAHTRVDGWRCAKKYICISRGPESDKTRNSMQELVLEDTWPRILKLIQNTWYLSQVFGGTWSQASHQPNEW